MADSHVISPHMQVGALMDGDRVLLGSGEWVCGVKGCGRPLKGTYLRPVIPWEHRPEKIASENTVLPGLGTTE